MLGAKKYGPAGTTLVVVKEEVLGKVPTRYLHVGLRSSRLKDSMFNTPPVFAVYTSMLTLDWLQKLGGIKAIEEKNKPKQT